MFHNFRLVLLLASFLFPWLSATAEQTCVSDYPEATPGADFIDNADGTVTHKKTGLTWMRCALGQTWDGTNCSGTTQTYSWQGALDAADAWNTAGGYAGYTDWRVPTVNELRSLVETKCHSPAINAGIFPNTSQDWHWSSSPDAYGSGNAWIVDFYSGSSGASFQSFGREVRLVRGGEWFGPSDFQDQTGVTPDQQVISNSVTLDGVADGAAIGSTGASYSINEGGFTNQAGTVKRGDRIRLQVTASSKYATAIQASLKAGDLEKEFTVTTKAEAQTCNLAAPASTPTSAFTDNHDGTVTHKKTGLTWMRCVLGHTWDGTGCVGSIDIHTWASALQAVDTSNHISGYAGKTDWRVPTKSELDSIMEPQCQRPAINALLFPNTYTGFHWSSSRSADSTYYAWTLDFDSGNSDGSRDYARAVRPVRGGQWSGTVDLQDQSGAALTQEVTSNVITLADIPDGTVIRITGGSYSINNGPYTSQDGTVQAGDQIRVRVISSSHYNTTVTATLTIGGVSGDFQVTTQAPPPDATPDPFSFTAVTGAALSQPVTSDPITVTGIDSPATITISGGEYSIDGGAFGSQAGTVQANQQVRVLLTSSPSYNTMLTATLTIGGVGSDFQVTTQAPPPDTTPDPFGFTAITGAGLGQAVTSDSITVTGIDAPATIAISGGEYSIDGGAFVSQAGQVQANQQVRVRLTAAADYDTTLTATLTIGGISADFQVTTQAPPPDTTPDPFSFNTVARAKPNQTVISNTITVSGINVPASISISGGSYSINGKAFTRRKGTVSAGDQVRARLTAAADYDTTVTATLTIGGVSAEFQVTTQAPPADTTPDPFGFTAVTDAGLGQPVTSNPITVTGIDAPASIAISGGEYSVNGNTFTKQAGTVRGNDQVRVRLTSAPGYNATVTATLSIGGVSGDFQVTTQAPPPDTTPDPFSFTAVTDAEPNQTVISNPITVSGIDTPAPISVGAGSYSINGTAFTHRKGTVKAGDQVRARITASADHSTTVTATITIGGVSGDFQVTTQSPPADTTPDPFSFAAVTGAALGQTVTSDPITVTGIDAPTSITISGGMYSVNGKPFTKKAGTVLADDQVQVRLTSSDQYDTAATATLTIDGFSGAFTVTTQGKPSTCDAPANWSADLPAPTPLQPAISPGKSYGQSLAATCEWLWIGAPEADFGGQKNRGAVYRWRKSATGGWEASDKPISSGAAGDLFGSALAANDAWAVVGAPKADRDDLLNIGRVYLYQRQGKTWRLATSLDSPELKNQWQFGSALALTDTWLAVGAPGSQESADSQNGDGVVYLFALQNGKWELRQTLNPARKKGRFGASLALDGDRLIVGAPATKLDRTDNRGSGSVYAYRRKDNQWILDTGFPLPDVNDHRDGQLGSALALQGDTLAVSAPMTTISEFGASYPQTGRVFLYSWNGANQDWSLSDTILQEKSANLTEEDRFGSSLALANQGQWLLVGAPGSDLSTKLQDAGRGYLYQFTGVGPGILQQFEGTRKNQGLGRSAALLPDSAFVGAHAGQVWMYRPE